MSIDLLIESLGFVALVAAVMAAGCVVADLLEWWLE